MLNFNEFVNINKNRSQRQHKVATAIQRALSEIFTQGMISSPLLFEKPISISDVKISPDLSSTTVYFYPLIGTTVDEPQLKEILKELKVATPYIRSLLAKKVKLRSVPNLIFKIDTNFDVIDRLNQIMREQEEE